MVTKTQKGENDDLSMTVLYKNKSVKEQFCSAYKKKWRYPEQVKRKLEAAENYIRNADSLLVTEVSNHYE